MIRQLTLRTICRKTNLLALQHRSTVTKKTPGDKEARFSKPDARSISKNMMYSWPWLRQLGFYGTLKTRSYSQCLLDADIFLGYQFPTWLWSKSIDFQLQIRIPSFIRMQNRVSSDSPLMVACRQGDIDRIRRHLVDKSGSVGDRLSCTGRTPLMV